MAKAKVLIRKMPPVKAAPVIEVVVDKAAEKKAALSLMANALKMQDANGHKVRPEQIDEFLALAVS